MTKKRFFIIGFVIFVASIQVGCFSPVKVKSAATYTIAPFKQSAFRYYSDKGKKTLLVSMPVAASGYTTSKMIYVSVPYKLKSFSENRWVAPPAKLLLPYIADRLRQTKRFRAVVTPPFSGISQYQLTTRLLVLQQEFLTPESRIHLVVSATLLNSRNSEVLATRLFDIYEPSPGNDPYSGVIATNKAVKRLTTAIAKFVTYAVRR